MDLGLFPLSFRPRGSARADLSLGSMNGMPLPEISVSHRGSSLFQINHDQLLPC